jgi:hypothetical protein
MAANDTWEGSGPFATGTGNRVIQSLLAASDNETVYSGTGSGTVLKYVISPFVVSVAVPASGRYNPGDALDFTVTWSTNMTVGGSPQLAITLDGVTRYASYLDSPTGTTTRFRYIVQAGDTDADGIVIGVLGLNGGTVRSTGGTDANLTLNSVGSTVGVLVDSSSPTLAANIVVNNQLDPQQIVLSFSEALTAGSLGNPGDWTVKANGGSPSYGVASVALTAAAEVTLTLNAVNIDSAATYIANSAANAHLKVTPSASLSDLAGNTYAAGEVTESGATHVLDTTAPTLVAVSADTPTDTGGALHGTSSEKARGYWVAVASGAAAPSAAEVKAGVDYGAVAVVAHGSGALPAGTAGTIALSGLSTGTTYDIHVANEDAAGNLSAGIGSAALTTTRNGICGSAHGSAVTQAPATNLCSVGAASAVAGTGPWTWTCAGTFGGTDASCTAVVYVPPTVINEGHGNVASGETAYIAGPAEVVAHGGSTVVVEATAAGASIEVPPTGNAPAIAHVGGQALTISSGGGTTHLDVIAVKNSSGEWRTVLRVSGCTGATPTIGSTAGTAGDALFAMDIAGRTVLLHSTGVAVEVSIAATGNGECGSFVTAGQVELVLGNTTRSAVREADATSAGVVMYSGETACFGATTGHFNGLRLGTVAGGGTGDPLTLELPDNLSLAATVPRLDGLAVRIDGNLRDAVMTGLGATLLDGSDAGVLELDIDGMRVHAVPLGPVCIDAGRADGFGFEADGRAAVTRNGVTVRFAPSVPDLAQFAADLAAALPEATTTLQPDGVLVAHVGTAAIAVRPAWATTPETSLATGFVTDAAGQLVYVQDQRRLDLYPAFADFASLVLAVTQAMPGSVATTNADGTVTLALDGQSWTLVPAYTLDAAPPGSGLWWATEGGFMLHNTDGTQQGFQAE